ncbi:MAG: ATP-binding protein [Bacteroidota bacterium]
MFPDKIRILMIDDDEEDYFLTRDLLEDLPPGKYVLEWVPSFDDGLKRILEKKHDVYLVDYRLGARTGDELIREAIKRGCEEPLILLTGQNNREADNLALKAGAADYLEKGNLSARTLENAIRYSVANANHVKEIKALNADLERRVKERTLILEEAVAQLNKTQKELEQALKKEKDLNDLKSRFVSMASHEFRTPLAAILSSLALIRQYMELNDKEKQLKHIDRIKSSVNGLTDIINDVLSVSKLEEGKVMLRPERVSLPEFVADIMKEMQGIAREGQQLVYAHMGGQEYRTDKKVFKHILFNLVSNAIKFSAEGKSIDITTTVSTSGLELTVKDRGIGISQEDQNYIFDRFFRAQNATNIQGTGLGLNIVAKYVEMLGGKISFSSELGLGTLFTVYLPAGNR